MKFDGRKFTWLGSFETSNNLIYMRSDTPCKTIHDVTKASEPPKCGSTGTESPSYFMVKLLNEAIGAKFTVVTGYQGGQEIDLAVERMLRDAFAKTLKDPDLLAEAKKKLLEIDPTGGHELEALAKDVLSADKDLVDRLRQLLGK